MKNILFTFLFVFFYSGTVYSQLDGSGILHNFKAKGIYTLDYTYDVSKHYFIREYQRSVIVFLTGECQKVKSAILLGWYIYENDYNKSFNSSIEIDGHECRQSEEIGKIIIPGAYYNVFNIHQMETSDLIFFKLNSEGIIKLYDFDKDTDNFDDFTRLKFERINK